jgi:hypothetical protein
MFEVRFYIIQFLVNKLGSMSKLGIVRVIFI